MYTTTFSKNDGAVVYEVDHKFLDKVLIMTIAHLITQRDPDEVLHTDTIENATGKKVYDASQIIIPTQKENADGSE